MFERDGEAVVEAVGEIGEPDEHGKLDELLGREVLRDAKRTSSPTLAVRVSSRA